jgi:hypothetical protein
VRVCVILIGEGPVPLLARKSALSMPSMGKRMGLANPQDGRDDVNVDGGDSRPCCTPHRSTAGHDINDDLHPTQYKGSLC